MAFVANDGQVMRDDLSVMIVDVAGVAVGRVFVAIFVDVAAVFVVAAVAAV